jgi:secreted PhoX family phosphatase
MAKDFDLMEDSNRSTNPSIHEVIDQQRRGLLQGGAAVSLASVLAPLAALSGCAAVAGGGPKIGFKGIPVGMGDKLVVPEGYVATILAPWGEPVGIAGNMPAFKMDGSNSAADQAVQMGMHHDGLEYFPLDGSRRGLIAINHEYTDDGLLHVGGFNNMNLEKVRKSQNAHGLSVFEVELTGGKWDMVRPSRYARRFP